ncbi:hypothetical protein [Geodermatophilus sp. CPCC 205506]|uniref:hypothetical protein n=1 Tax=Geodermatophilus sp. CPCC 205506 TaxID=2936596 RepID=UPI003EEEBD3C
MTPSFRVAVTGPSRVGKTTLLTAVLSDTDALLTGTPVSVTMDEPTRNRVRKQQRDLRRAIEVGEFDAAALGGTQSVSRYRVALQAEGDESIEVPFELLDYPGQWLDPEVRAQNPQAKEAWPGYLDHVRNSIMLLVPIDAAVLMEAVLPRQRAAVGELLALLDVEEVGRTWAKGRLTTDKEDEPAVVVLAPLKCEKYFSDNGGHGQDEARLREKVKERYGRLLEIIAAETRERPQPVRVVYAPVDTYGCVELMEARWHNVSGHDLPDFTAHYRFRGRPPRISVRAAGTVMQELARAVLAGQEAAEAEQQKTTQGAYDRHVARKAEAKGFWGTIEYYLSGEAGSVNEGIQTSASELARISLRRGQLTDATKKLVAAPIDRRVEIWSGDGPR